MTQRIDYQTVIADLEAKRARMNAEFDSAIRAIRQIIAMEEVSGIQAPLFKIGVLSQPSRYATGSMVDVAIRHLSSVGGGPVPNMELARALDQGGFPHRSKNFPNTLNSVLHRRAKTVGDVRKTEGGWQLATAS